MIEELTEIEWQTWREPALAAVRIVGCLVHSPDAVLMDVRMPRMNGLAATRKLRQLQRDGLIPPFPVIGATAEAGMDIVLAKPVARPALGQALARLVAARSSV